MNILKKQGVAWVITIVMIVAAIGIGTGKANTTPLTPEPSQTYAPIVDDASQYVYDDAGVLSSSEEKDLSRLIGEMCASTGSVAACVTTNYGRDDLYDFALDYADRIGLGAYDFIVVLDISGENYWLVQGAGLINEFTDEDCGNYAWDYMEDHFARGDYGTALTELVKALYDWCQRNNW